MNKEQQPAWAAEELGLASRPTSRTYIDSLTGLRGVAALSVFMFHYASLHPGVRLDLTVPLIGHVLHTPFGMGFVGVDLFFVLSGFLLSLPFAEACLKRQNHPPLKRYFQRRLLRVFPAYYAQWGIIMLAGSWLVNWAPLSAMDVLGHLFMFFNIGPEPVKPIVGLWWSLPVELAFYLLLPLIAPFMRPGRWLALITAGFVISVLYRIWAAAHFAGSAPGASFLAASQIPGGLPLFLMGASAALLVKWMEVNGVRSPKPGVATLLFLAGVTLTILWLWLILLPNGSAYWSGHWSMVLAPIALGLFMSTVILGLYWGSRMGNFLCANKLIYFIGVVSYSLYLWHFVLMKKIQSLGGEFYAQLPGIWQFIICTALSLAVATLSYYLVERPFFRLRRGL